MSDFEVYDDGIYIKVEESIYEMVISKEAFVKAYNIYIDKPQREQINESLARKE